MDMSTGGSSGSNKLKTRKVSLLDAAKVLMVSFKHLQLGSKLHLLVAALRPGVSSPCGPGVMDLRREAKATFGHVSQTDWLAG